MTNQHAKEQASARVTQWSMASSACILAGSALSVWQKPVSKYLGAVLQMPLEDVKFGLGFLQLVWIMVALFCGMRAHKLRLEVPGAKSWREHKRKLEEDAAQAEKYLGIER